MAHAHSTLLFDLPKELRIQIFKYVFGKRAFWYTGRAGERAGIIGRLALLQVNRQVHDEAMKALEVTIMRIFPTGEPGKLYRVMAHISDWSQSVELIHITFSAAEFVDLPYYSPTMLLKTLDVIKELAQAMPAVKTIDILVDRAEKYHWTMCDWNFKALGKFLLTMDARFQFLVKQKQEKSWRSSFFRLEAHQPQAGENEVVVTIVAGTFKQSDDKTLPA